MIGAFVRFLLNLTVLMFLALALLMKSCVSEVEVARLTSPGNLVDAIVIETDAGAASDFGYHIYLVPRRIGVWYGTHIAFLYGATRSHNAYGVNLHWLGPNELAIEYLRTRDGRVIDGPVDMRGQQFHIMLRPGTMDSTAPGGSMQFNLNRQNQHQ